MISDCEESVSKDSTRQRADLLVSEQYAFLDAVRCQAMCRHQCHTCQEAEDLELGLAENRKERKKVDVSPIWVCFSHGLREKEENDTNT